MYRGQPVTSVYEMDFMVWGVKSIEVTYKQNKQVIIQKNVQDLFVETKPGHTDIKWQITQEESMRFVKGYANVQLRMLFGDDQLYVQNIGIIEVKEPINPEVIINDEDYIYKNKIIERV